MAFWGRSRFFFIVFTFAALGSVPYFFCVRASAQNMNQFQEEEIKDKERAVKQKELEAERKAEEDKLLAQPVTEEELQNSNLVICVLLTTLFIYLFFTNKM